MIDAKQLLADLQKRVRLLEDDLRTRCNELPDVNAPLKAEYESARSKGRTALTYNAWRDEELTQIAVAWILSGVFVRFLEDNELIEVPFIAGATAARQQRAHDEHSLFFRQQPTASERDYFEHVFTEMGKLPGLRDFFSRRHNPLWHVGPSADAARDLLNFWRKTDPDTGRIHHDFTDPEWNTRFLGDLYQDLSEAARKKFALLQTPEFIERFILDRTLTPAIQAFGYQVARLIDPTCGSGHFCLGAFERLYRLWLENDPGGNPAALAQKALDGVFGVDLNPFAVAIARFRLLLAALRVTGVTRLRNAYDFQIHLTTGDSLLHGRRFRHHEVDTGPQRTFGTEDFPDELKHHYEVEDTAALHRILGQPYHAVVGNPPYITVKDRALSELYRARYPSCHRKYSLSVPFMERFFDLAVKGDGTPRQPAGFVGQITANSFMKREFGKKLIEEYLPRWDLTHVLDTSGAYIPGHGTPTVILFGKNQPPVSGSIRTVLGIKSEAEKPNEPEKGIVWSAILRQIDAPGSSSQWVSSADSPRANFVKHPWSIGGGGAAELRETLTEASDVAVESLIDAIGFFGIPNGEEVLLATRGTFGRHCVEREVFRTIVAGENVRDWVVSAEGETLLPYDGENAVKLQNFPGLSRWLWPCRTELGNRTTFGKETYFAAGKPWWEWHQIALHRLESPAIITYANIATHNNFAMGSTATAYNLTAQIITLNGDQPLEQYSKLCAFLSSSVAGFLLRQVCFPKGGSGIGRGIQPEAWENRFAYDGTKIKQLPLPARQPTQLPTLLVQTSTAQQGQTPAATLASWGGPGLGDLRACLARARDAWHRQRRQLIAWQEELDWQVYEAFGLVETKEGLVISETVISHQCSEATGDTSLITDSLMTDYLPPLELGQRAFEIALARKMAAGEVQTTWFERHGSTPITELPPHWPAAYRERVERRLRRIADDPAIRLIEQPEYKRRWNTEPWDEQFTQAARDWLLARLEGYFHEGNRVCELKDGFSSAAHGFTAAVQPAVVSTNQLAAVVEADPAFLHLAEIYTGSPTFSVSKLVRELVEKESVPFLPGQRYKETGLRKRQDWERVWNLQRKEDEIERGVRNAERGMNEDQLKALIRKTQQQQVGDIPVPPKYASADFRSGSYWKLRGKLDVPKERWIIYPGAEREGDPSPVIAWAGWDHLQQAQALAAYYIQARDHWGWTPEKLKPLLAGVAELLPWLKQWHNEFNPDYGSGIGDYFAGFLDEEARKQGTTVEALNRLRLGSSLEERA